MMESSVSEASAAPGNVLSSVPATSGPSWAARVLLALLAIIAIWSFLWPAYRAFLNVEIDMNEGWNAYMADAAVHGRAPLYPAPDSLVTNNYPPLSFYIVGTFSRLVGDPILAGRLLSLAAVIGISVAIAMCIRRLGGSRMGAAVGAFFFTATMSRFFSYYVGMDDPQLLAQAVMAFGFAGFIAAWNRDRGYLVPILLMVVAGFIKHNIIAIPVTAFVWLVIQRPRTALKCYSIAFLAIALGFGACYALYGRNFFFNLLSPRVGSGISFRAMLPLLKRLDVALIASVCLAFIRPRDPRVRLCSGLVVTGTIVYFLEKTGAGVDVNAVFDLLIAVSIGAGLAFTHAPAPPPRLARVLGPQICATVLLLALCLRLLPTKRVESIKAVRMFFDPGLRNEIATRENAMADSVARVRAVAGDATASTMIMVCYRSGKPLAVDRFNTEQRMLCGALPKNAIKCRIRKGTLTDVDPDPRAAWDKPLAFGGPQARGGSDGE